MATHIRNRNILPGLMLLSIYAAAPAVRSSAGPTVPEVRVRAALIYQLLNYVDWPEDFPKGEMSVCVIGHESLAGELRRVSQSPGTPPIRTNVRTLSRLKDAVGCHVLVAGEFDERQLQLFFAANTLTPLLTIGEGSQFLSMGGMVSFQVEQHRNQIEINPVAAARARLRISSRVLRIARLHDPR